MSMFRGNRANARRMATSRLLPGHVRPASNRDRHHSGRRHPGRGRGDRAAVPCRAQDRKQLARRLTSAGAGPDSNRVDAIRRDGRGPFRRNAHDHDDSGSSSRAHGTPGGRRHDGPARDGHRDSVGLFRILRTGAFRNLKSGGRSTRHDARRARTVQFLPRQRSWPLSAKGPRPVARSCRSSDLRPGERALGARGDGKRCAASDGRFKN